jgi:hypothetical protein
MSKKNILWTCLMVILILGLLGLLGGIGRGLISLPLIIAAYVLILSLVTGNRRVA